jgi:hypothetical protein
VRGTAWLRGSLSTLWLLGGGRAQHNERAPRDFPLGTIAPDGGEVREVLAAARGGNERARLAFDAHRELPRLECLGLALDAEANAGCRPDTDVARRGSAARILVVATREDLSMLAEGTQALAQEVNR